jgi:hypothetical protein
VDKRVPNGLLPAIVLAVGTLVLVFVRAFRSSYGDGWNDILEVAPFYVGIISASFIFIAIYNSYADARDRRLARGHPTAVVFGSEMTPALKQRLKSDPDRYASPAVVGRAPHLFTVVADPDGITFWNGPASNPVRFWGIDWRTVSGIRPATHRLEYKHVHGLVFDTSAGAVLGTLELAPRPKGTFSASFSVSDAQLTALTERMTELWRTASQARPNGNPMLGNSLR